MSERPDGSVAIENRLRAGRRRNRDSVADRDGDVSSKVGFTISQATKALRESRGIALLYFRPLHWKEVRGQRHAPAAPYPRERPVPIVQEAGWASGPVWTGTKNLAPPGFDPRTIQPIGSRYTG